MWERVAHRMSGSGRGLTGNQPTTDNGTVCAEIASRHLAGDLPANNGSERRLKVEETGPRVGIMTERLTS